MPDATEALTTSIAGYGCDILIFALRLAGLRFMSGFLRFLRCGRIIRYVPIADIQLVGVTKENPGTLPGVWLSEYRFAEHATRTLSSVCRVGRYSSADFHSSRCHYY